MPLLESFDLWFQNKSPELHWQKQKTLWSLKNRRRIQQHRQIAQSLDPALGRIVEKLRKYGIAVTSFEELWGQEGAALFATVQERGNELWSSAKDETSKHLNKEYKVSLLPVKLNWADPLFQLTLNPRLLAVANRYLGLCGYLREIDLWWDHPTETPAKETQLWHRDGDDFMSLKVFIYLTDVPAEAGPFCFIPGTHTVGPLRHLQIHPPRVSDERMEQVISRNGWKICTGTAGSLIFCDTGGYHKGLKPVSQERLLFMMQYTSGKPWYPRRFQPPESSPRVPLDFIQLQALGTN